METKLSQGAGDNIYYNNIYISFHIIINVGGGNLAHRSDAVYFAELMVVQYACDQLIGIDNANIKECLASDAQNIRMLSKKSINSFEEQFENVHRALLYVKSNYKSLYDFSVVFEEICKLLPNLNNYLFMAFFNNPLLKDEQGIIYVKSERQYSTQAPNS